MSTAIRIMVNGAQGRMGQIAVAAVTILPGFELIAQCGRGQDLASEIKRHKPDIVIDFTTPDTVYANAEIILRCGVRPIIGTTGLQQVQILRLQNCAKEKKLGGIIAPNFSLGALLLMRFSKMATRYFPRAEIIEMHHEHKKDAPSGSALLTAEMMNAQTSEVIAIHSVRLPGILARQQVIFGGEGETLTLDHNTQSREVYKSGIRLACEKVMALDELLYGLEQLLD